MLITIDRSRNNAPMPLKKATGRSYCNSVAITRRMRNPSWYVRSFDSLPSGRSLNPTGTSTCGTRRLTAWTVSSVSISNSRESAGNDLTKRRLKMR